MNREEAHSNDKKSFLQILTGDRNGWIICIVSCFVNLVRSGVNYTFGLYIAEFRKLYQSPMAELNWIAVTVTCLSFSCSPLPSLIIKQYPKNGYMISSMIGTLLQTGACLSSSFVTHIPWLFLTFGIMYGIGSCFTMMASSLILGEFFPKSHVYHEFATSIYQSAFPAGLLIFSPFYAWLIETVNWRWSMRIAGAKSFIIGFVCSLFLLLEKPKFEDSNKHIKSQGSCSCRYWLDIFQRPERVFWVTGLALIFASQLVAVNNLPHYMEERGFRTMESSTPLMMLGLFELLMYIVVPFMGRKLRGNLIYVNIVSSTAWAMMFFIWPSTNATYAIILSFSAVIGIFGALSFTFMFPGSGEAMDMDLNEAWTISCSFCGIGALLGPLISGAIYDFTNSYDDVFYAVAAVSLLNALVFAGVPLTKWIRKYHYERLN